ncbi:MAG: hypothetical protein EA357_06685 [Micavibrio sp.]|nr:MAG: hypothetical protein EA357_06685 [Micavibrio sp.]
MVSNKEKTKTGGVANVSSSGTFALIIFAVSLFLSASLMFAVQPMIGKMLLPLAGGTPASWIVAMAFFQLALLAGYLLAWIMSRFTVRVHTLLLVALLALGFVFLPVRVADHAHLLDTRGIAPSSVFLILLFAIGLPFTAISTVSSTLQRLFTATTHKDAQDPYFLYAASNAGSLIGLLSYPVLIEPLLPLYEQSIYWQTLYGALIVMCLFCLALTGKPEKNAPAKKTATKKAAKTAENVAWNQRILWLLLAFFPSSLLMGTTMHVTMDIISVPLLWVAPLGLYLLTHIMAFSRRKLIKTQTLFEAHAICACSIVLVAVKFPGLDDVTMAWSGALVSLGTFFMIALALHTRLAEARPHNRNLTQFYFFLALGGALGGSFNAFAAPLMFDSLIEFPIIAALSCFLNPHITRRIKSWEMLLFFTGIFTLIFYFYALKSGIFAGMPYLQMSLVITAFFMMVNFHPKLGGAVALTVFLCGFYLDTLRTPHLHIERNFFGVMRVHDTQIRLSSEGTATVRFFRHGTTLHGMQNIDADAFESRGTSYYGPVSDPVEAYHPEHIGLIGLGAGTVRCYHAPGRYFTMYEIDPAVVKIAKEYFTYLEDCSNEKDAIVIGDGRLELEKRIDDRYDLLILDAFSSDSIPAHLLTREAFESYKTRLTENGIIAVHISNRYLDLRDVITATAAETDFYILHLHRTQTSTPLEFPSRWMILLPKHVDLTPMIEKGWQEIATDDINVRPWTDAHSNILSTLRFRLF